MAGDRLTPGASPPPAPRVALGRGDRRWLGLLLISRLGATVLAAGLLGFTGASAVDVAVIGYGLVSTALLATRPGVRNRPVVWTADSLILLAAILQSGDWRSPYYLLWLTTLALPAISLPRPMTPWLAATATLSFLAVAVAGGPAPGQLQLVSTETLAIHLALPGGLVLALAYASDALRRLAAERAERERLAIEAERRRIAWELHDSAKQRIHAAHLLISSLLGADLGSRTATVGRAVVELESAASDMDVSLAELRSPLEGRPLDEALRARAAELRSGDGPAIRIEGAVPVLPPLVGAHLYRIACEAITNALRHADAHAIDVELAARASTLTLRVRDDGRGLPADRRQGASGLQAMESRAATIGARLRVDSPRPGGGTVVELALPFDKEDP